MNSCKILWNVQMYVYLYVYLQVLVIVIMSSDSHYTSCKLPVLDSHIPSLAVSLTPLPESLYGYMDGIRKFSHIHRFPTSVLMEATL